MGSLSIIRIKCTAINIIKNIIRLDRWSYRRKTTALNVIRYSNERVLAKTRQILISKWRLKQILKGNIWSYGKLVIRKR